MIFNIVVSKKIAYAELQQDQVIVCGNSNYVINFALDDEWEDYEIKTAVFTFKRNGETKVIEIVFTGTECNVPVLSGIDEVFVGLYAGDLHTTTAARIPCQKSVLCNVSKMEDPPKDVYTQLLEVLKNNFPVEAGIAANEAAINANAAAEQTTELNNQLNEFINDTRNSIEEIFASVMAGDVLWENNDISVAFEPQTIELDLSEYKRFRIIFKDSLESDSKQSEAECSRKNILYHLHCITEGTTSRAIWREYTITDSGIQFGSGHWEDEEQNKYCIPVAVVAYKY